MLSVRAGPSAQALAMSQPFGLPNGVILQGPDPTACRRLGLFFFFQKLFINMHIFLTDYFVLL
jgi:hypothetical protein